MRCPKCDHDFFERTLDGIPVQVCSSCNGIWFDSAKIKAYLGRVLERSGQSPVLATLREIEPVPTELTCPVCQEKWLKAIKPRGVDIEQCSGCRGVFLDPGEIDLISLQTISDAVDRRPTASTPLTVPSGSGAVGAGNTFPVGISDVLEIVVHLME